MLGITLASRPGTGSAIPSILQGEDPKTALTRAATLGALLYGGTMLFPGAPGAGPAGAGGYPMPPAIPEAGGAGASAGGLGGVLGSIAGSPVTQLLGKLLPGLLGAYGAKEQSNDYEALAREYMAMGAPYRDKLASLYANPGAFLTSPEVQVPVDQATSSLARALSVGGNPIGSGNALQEIQNFSANQLFGRLGQEKDRLAGFGGLSSYNQAAPGASGAAINAQGGVYDALGATAANVFDPPKTLAQTLAEFNRLSRMGA